MTINGIHNILQQQHLFKAVYHAVHDNGNNKRKIVI